jgi:FtsH-binding integral membrane protein
MENNIIQLDAAAETQRFMVKVYAWMSLALAITGFTAVFTAGNATLFSLIFSQSWVWIGLIILEFVLVAYLSIWIAKMSAQRATIVFILYSVLNGLTLSIIFLIYTTGSIASTFFVTAGTFAVMSAYGYLTKSDLSKWGNILFMGLIGIIIASIVNYFMQSETLYAIITYIGVLIFVALTAYDTQKIKTMNIIGNEGTDEDKKEAIMGALTLYLDFINLFLYLLRLLGRRR